LSLPQEVFGGQKVPYAHQRVSVTRKNMEMHDIKILQKALRQIQAPTRGYSTLQKAREYLSLYFRRVQDPKHEILVDIPWMY